MREARPVTLLRWPEMVNYRIQASRHSVVMIDSRDVPWASVPSTSHVVARTSGFGEGRNISTGLRLEEVESSEEAVESGESKAKLEPAGRECEPANVNAEREQSEDEAPYLFLRDALAQAPVAVQMG